MDILKGEAASTEMRKVSGEVNSNSKLVVFIYLLGRDYLPLGAIEEIVHKLDYDDSTEFSNGWLANYAKNVADRLEK